MTKTEFQVMSIGTTSQRCRMSLETGKGKEMDFLPELLEGMQLHLDCSSYDLDFGAPEL